MEIHKGHKRVGKTRDIPSFIRVIRTGQGADADQNMAERI